MKWHWDRYFSEYFGILLSLSFHHYSILIFIYTFNDKGAKRGYFPERNSVSKIGELRPFSWSLKG
jgi:hypothetical protein